MDKGQIALKLFLDELRVPFEIRTFDDRKRVQKAVYLGQLSGVDLGYRFGWYIRGPYSTSLTRDYFGLAEALASEDKESEGLHLKQAVKDRLAKIGPLMNPPEEIDLNTEDWLELVASLHFLRRVSKLEENEAFEVLQKEKSHLFPYVHRAKQTLIEAELLT